MQKSRKLLTIGLLAAVAVMAIATVAGHPIIPTEALAALGALPFAMTGELDSKGLKELLEKQGQAFDEFKRTNDELIKAKADGKAVADLEAKLAKLNTAFDDAQAQLKALEKRQGRPGTGGDADPAKAEHKAAFGSFLRKGDDGNLAELQKKAYNITTDADGGFAVPEELDRDILSLMVDVSPIREIANVKTVGTSDYKKLVNTRGTASGWVDEDDARTATSGASLAQVTPFMGEIYAYPQATQQMLDDVFFDAEQFIVDECYTEFAQKEGAAFVTGDGTKKPKGFLAYATAATADGARAFGTLEHVATGVAGDWAAASKSDVLITVVHKLKAGMRANARWVMNKNIMAEVRTFKDMEGNYIWRPGLEAGQPATLLGYGITEAEDMPAKAANSLSIAFGDFKRGYTIVDRIGTRILRDPYTNKPYVGFYVTKRVGGMVVDSQAIKVLKFAAA
ncbi:MULTISPECIES: phage major capsid protein [unclassified Acidovorax]|uniref:phage major capsid protein n=1 Tax=unclassified Acidovorax TaxID=2684926 RepID=UPI001C43AABA|nr:MULTISPECIES: phage major capsid protein [unclassified Acidovorax]MBV7459840.1 phage major capsid protein [Acidovorax sp. sif0632]MBV7464865.1 phage major capsid protein [Acidovorax sp. sif0613]